MTVKAVTPSADAASPAHPDHARWVKERTLASEIEHTTLIGGTLRDAEARNIASLARLTARQRAPKPTPAKPAKPDPEVTKEKLAAAGVTRRPVRRIAVQPMACGYCGHCIACKRLTRVAEISRRCKAGQFQLAPLANQLTVMVIAFNTFRRLRDAGAEFPFDHPRESVRLRALDAVTERICDRSTGILGEWR